MKTRLIFSLFIFNFMLLKVSAFELNKDFQIPKFDGIDFEKYGMEIDKKEKNGQTVVTIKDKILNEKTIFEYNQQTGKQIITTTLSNGKQIYNFERFQNQITETEEKLGKKFKYIQVFDKNHNHELTTLEFKNNEWVKIDQKFVSNDALKSCNEAADQTIYNSYLSNWFDHNRDILNFSIQSGSSQKTFLGNNVRTVGCNDYSAQGETTLAEDLNQAVTQGFSCVENLYQLYKDVDDEAVRRRVSDIRRKARLVFGNFIEPATNMFTFQCVRPEARTPGSQIHIRRADDHAVAITCDGLFQEEAIAPGIQLNLTYFDNPSLTATDRAQTIFHELYHHGRIYHTPSTLDYDTIYALSLCCFGLNSEVTSPRSKAEIAANMTCTGILAQDHGSLRAPSSEIHRIQSLLDPASTQ